VAAGCRLDAREIVQALRGAGVDADAIRRRTAPVDDLAERAKAAASSGSATSARRFGRRAS
jgi:hypothetical protein